jgi:hypothetical protein
MRCRPPYRGEAAHHSEVKPPTWRVSNSGMSPPRSISDVVHQLVEDDAVPRKLIRSQGECATSLLD